MYAQLNFTCHTRSTMILWDYSVLQHFGCFCICNIDTPGALPLNGLNVHDVWRTRTVEEVLVYKVTPYSVCLPVYRQPVHSTTMVAMRQIQNGPSCIRWTVLSDQCPIPAPIEWNGSGIDGIVCGLSPCTTMYNNVQQLYFIWWILSFSRNEPVKRSRMVIVNQCSH